MMGPLEDAIAESEDLSTSNGERLELVHRNSLRLLKLVNTLLDFSRIEAGRIQASYEPTDLAFMTAELASVFRAAIERAEMKLVIDCVPLREPVYVDREMWEKIVLNLISNAFKFTFEGEIEVSWRAAGEMAELTVRDTGTGIPAHELPHLFDRFHRVDSARGRSYEGSGIGLALVQGLAKLHGGNVRVESEVGHGSSFVVSIPLGKSHLPADRIKAERTIDSTGLRSDAYVAEVLRWLPDASSTGQTPDVSADVRRKSPPHSGRKAQRILLADDNADMRDYVRRFLGESGYEVETAADGLAALGAAQARKPDLIVTDVMMPGLDGFELLRELRSDATLGALPIILLSARAGEEARNEGMHAGADDYLIKPFSARELLARIESHLKMARFRHETAEALREANTALTRSNADLQQFAYSASHDLQEPLRMVATCSEILKEEFSGQLGQKGNEYIGFMIKGASRMEHLLRDLRAYVLASTAGQEPREDVDADPILNNALANLGPAINESGASISHTTLPRVRIHEFQLEQLFQNVIGNSIRYRSHEPPQIHIAAERQAGDWLFSVKDSGIGIEPQYQEQVF
jgi:signal transduction histidine kinase